MTNEVQTERYKIYISSIKTTKAKCNIDFMSTEPIAYLVNRQNILCKTFYKVYEIDYLRDIEG